MLTALFIAHLLALCIVAGVTSVLRAHEEWGSSCVLSYRPPQIENLPSGDLLRYVVETGMRYRFAIVSVLSPRMVRDRCSSFGDPYEALTVSGVRCYSPVPAGELFAILAAPHVHAVKVRALLACTALRYRSGLYIRRASLGALCASLFAYVAFPGGWYVESAGVVLSTVQALVSCATVAFVAWYSYAAARFGVGSVPGLAMVLPFQVTETADGVEIVASASVRRFSWDELAHFYGGPMETALCSECGDEIAPIEADADGYDCPCCGAVGSVTAVGRIVGLV